MYDGFLPAEVEISRKHERVWGQMTLSGGRGLLWRRVLSIIYEPSFGLQGPFTLPVSPVDINCPLSSFLFPQPARTFKYQALSRAWNHSPSSLVPTP